MCDYTGLSYCPGCHWNARSVTPARILRNWQFEELEVSQASSQYLMLMLRRPAINVQTVNPTLFAVVQEMDVVRKGRRKIISMKEYLKVCRIASEQKILLQLSSR